MKEAVLLILLFSGIYIVIDKLFFFVANDALRTLLVYACMLFFFLWLVKNKIKNRNIDKKQVQLGKIRWDVFAFLCIGTILCKFVPMHISLLDVPFDNALISQIEETFFLNIVCYCFFAPFLEELVFRGLILYHLFRCYSPLIAILLSALIFGIMHVSYPVPTFLFGILSGLTYYYTSNLTYCILLHSFANLISQLLKLYLSHNATNIGTLEAIIESNLFYAIYIIISIGFIYTTYHILKKRTPAFTKEI
nr:type II CAAX endopeptidase family protein [uncultured Bacteroides sp.]